MLAISISKAYIKVACDHIEDTTADLQHSSNTTSKTNRPGFCKTTCHDVLAAGGMYIVPESARCIS